MTYLLYQFQYFYYRGEKKIVAIPQQADISYIDDAVNEVDESEV